MLLGRVEGFYFFIVFQNIQRVCTAKWFEFFNTMRKTFSNSKRPFNFFFNFEKENSIHLFVVVQDFKCICSYF